MPRLGRLPNAAAGASTRVERLVYERVGTRVLIPWNRPDRPAIEFAQRGERLRVELPHSRMFDLVEADQLPGDELRIPHDLELARAELAGALDPAQHRPVLGDVVRRDPDRLGDLVEHLPICPRYHDPDRRRPWISPRAPVDVEDELHD
jgi:hypothetical protein